jgi:hypothetical protein
MNQSDDRIKVETTDNPVYEHSVDHCYSNFFVRVSLDVIYLQLCFP